MIDEQVIRQDVITGLFSSEMMSQCCLMLSLIVQNGRHEVRVLQYNQHEQNLITQLPVSSEEQGQLCYDVLLNFYKNI